MRWDEMRTKFEKDRDAARISKEDQVNKQRKIANGAPTLFPALRDQVRTAVDSINASENLLQFAESGPPQSPGFKILYDRAGEHRQVTVVFDYKRELITTNVSGGSRQGYGGQSEYTITLDHEGQVSFADASGATYTLDALAQVIISRLL